MTNSAQPESTAIPPSAGWSEDEHHGHSVQFYSNDSFLLDALGRYIGTALGAGDAGIVVATAAHRQELAERLQMRGIDLALVQAQGRYVELDAREMLNKFMVSGTPHQQRFFDVTGPIIERARAAAGDAHARVAVFGEMVALLWAEGKCDAALRLEQLWNELAQNHSFTLRCAYPMSDFYRQEHSEALLKICAEHSHVIPAEGYTALESEQQRLRSITELQQKAQALETAVEERKTIQRSLWRREAELADFLENAVEGVQKVGGDQRIRYANKSLLDLLGYSEQEYVGHSLRDFYASGQTFDEFWQKLMRRETVRDFAADLRAKDGSLKHVLINSNGLWENGEFIHTRCFVRDITEQKHIEQVLRRSDKMAAVGRLAATIAHEINNPLEALTNLFYLLNTHPSLDDTARYFAKMADSELQRVSHITRQMLSFYRESPRPVRLRISEILDSVVDIYQPKLAKNNITVEKRYASNGCVEGFASELRQLFSNLIGNAIEACGADCTLRIHVFNSFDWKQPQRLGLRVVIADNGAGIQPELRKKVFEPFFTTKGESGTGLGLWVCRGIVQKHEGSIRFRSSIREGRSGTVFSIFLPVRVHQSAMPATLAA